MPRPALIQKMLTLAKNKEIETRRNVAALEGQLANAKAELKDFEAARRYIEDYPE